MKRLLVVLSLFFVAFLINIKPALAACNKIGTGEYGPICDGQCAGSGKTCSVYGTSCACKGPGDPTATPKPNPTNIPLPGTEGGRCPPCPESACTAGGYPWCDDAQICRCPIDPMPTKPPCGAFGPCGLYGREYCTKTRLCGAGGYDTERCDCGGGGGGGATDTPRPPTNTPGGPTLTPTPTPTRTPTPTLYPTSAVSGNLYIKNVAACSVYPNAAVTPAVRLVPQYPQGVTPICTTNLSASTYSCNISYNNQIAVPPPLSQSFTLSSTSQIHGVGSWFTGNLCTGAANNTRTITIGTSSTDWHIFFHIFPWFKIQDGSFTSGNLSFSIPDTVTKFDSDDLGNRYLVDGKSGTVTTSSTFPATSTLPISKNKWSKENYSYTQLMTSAGWLSYIKSRKKFTTITSLDEITKDGIYYYSGDLSINQAPDFNVILVVNGTATITNNLTQTSGFAIVSTSQIDVNSSVTQINGIFVASNFDTGGATTGLKVVGNISALTLTNDRDLTDNSKPSIFILFNPDTYLKLLPYLSISKYDWRQTQ